MAWLEAVQLTSFPAEKHPPGGSTTANIGGRIVAEQQHLRGVGESVKRSFRILPNRAIA